MSSWMLMAALLATAPAEVLYEYDVEVGPAARELVVEARFSRVPEGCWEIGTGLETFVSGAEVKRGRKWAAFDRVNRCFDAPRAGGKDVRVRYRFQLAEAGATADRRRRVYEDRGAFFVPPTAWLLRPSGFAEGRYRLAVRTPADLHFLTGLARVGPDTYEGRVEFMDGSPYAVLTREAPEVVSVGGGEIEWALTANEPAVPKAAVGRWIEESARVVADYFGGFPVPRVAVLAVPPATGGRGGGGGSTMGYASAAIRVGVRPGFEAGRDWVLVHEMVHLGLPNLAPEYRWMEEGLATYVEPVARARAGQLTEADVWGSFVRRMPQGLPGEGDQGLDHMAGLEGRQRWGRTYWGGALFWLAADVELLEKTGGRVGLDDLLAGVRQAGGDIRVRWEVSHLLDVAERVAGAPVVRELYDRQARAAGTTDLPALWSRLGVRNSPDGSVTFDDEAPLAWIRRRVTGPRPRSVGRLDP